MGFTLTLSSHTTLQESLLFEFDNLPSSSSGEVYLEVFLRGDYGDLSEYAELRDVNSNLIGTMDPAGECSSSYYSQTFILSQMDFNDWVDAGSVAFTLQSTTAVNPSVCTNNDAYIALCYEFPSSYTQTVSEVQQIVIDGVSFSGEANCISAEFYLTHILLVLFRNLLLSSLAISHQLLQC
jgi:hypothetical protein